MIEREELSPALRAEITRDLGQLHDARRRRLGLFSLLGLGITLGFGFAMGLAAPPGWPFFTSLVVFAVAGVALAAFAFGLRLPARRRLWPILAGGLGLGLLATALSIREGGAPIDFLHGGTCLGTGLGVAAVLILLGLALGRRVLRRHAPTGFLLGAGAGLLGVLPLHVACVHSAADHLMVWHGLVPIMGGVFGALAWTLLAPRPR
ncbi:MAG: hypothetical protein H6706_03765 [Myxococcales bacterium]|nr:hypothetical protein [Myxococcales bacterium]